MARAYNSGGAFGAPVAALPAQTSVVDGVDVDALLSAALGGRKATTTMRFCWFVMLTAALGG